LGGGHQSIDVSCPAKVNLHLRVLGKRQDGYHEILTLMQPVGPCDELHLELGGRGVRLECAGAQRPLDEGNLAYRAAKLLLETTGMLHGVSILLEKRIPIGAGLGGGSSDAAGVLRGLNQMLGNPVSEQELSELAAGLGADVPFFLHRGPALARGIGERLQAVRLGVALHYIIWFPGWPVSTRWVYENLDLGLTSGLKQFTIPQLIDRFEDIIALLHNDLETVTAHHHPWVERAEARLREVGAEGTLMSGSGPTVFGLFRERGAAQGALQRIRPGPGELLWYTQGLGSK